MVDGPSVAPPSSGRAASAGAGPERRCRSARLVPFVIQRRADRSVVLFSIDLELLGMRGMKTSAASQGLSASVLTSIRIV